MSKEVHITEAGNAYMVQLQVWTEGEGLNDHGKPNAVLSNGTKSDAELGAAVRKALATRIRTKKEKAAEPKAVEG